MADYREISHGIGRWSAQDVARESTPAEQEAERRYAPYPTALRRDFIEGAEWAESRYRELLEAAREYRDAPADDGRSWENFWLTEDEARAVPRLLAAAAALKEDGE